MAMTFARSVTTASCATALTTSTRPDVPQERMVPLDGPPVVVRVVVRGCRPRARTASTTSFGANAGMALPTAVQCAGIRPPTRLSSVVGLCPLIFSA